MSLRLLSLGLVLLVAAGCGVVTPAAATVNGHKIPESAVEQELARVQDDPNFRDLVRQQGDQVRGFVRRQILTQLITITFIEQQARQHDVRITDVQVSNFVESIKEDVGGEQAFADLLAAEQMSEERVRVLARRQLYQEHLERAVTADLEVDPDDVQTAYDQNIEDYTEYRLERITVAGEQEAEQIAEQAREGADFAALAREQSIDEAAEDGGELGWIAADRLVGLTVLLAETEVGEIAGPVAGDDGFEVYRVADRRQQSIADVRDEISEQLLELDRHRAFEQWLNEELGRADIIVNPKYGQFDPNTLAVVGSGGQLPE